MNKGNQWGPTAPRTAAINQRQPSVGADTLSNAVGHLHMEHPHPVHGEGLQHKSSAAIHYPVGRPGSVYKGK